MTVLCSRDQERSTYSFVEACYCMSYVCSMNHCIVALDFSSKVTTVGSRRAHVTER